MPPIRAQAIAYSRPANKHPTSFMPSGVRPESLSDDAGAAGSCLPCPSVRLNTFVDVSRPNGAVQGGIPPAKVEVHRIIRTAPPTMSRLTTPKGGYDAHHYPKG